MKRGIPLVLALAVGCGASDDSLMPLKVGAKARYAVEPGFDRYVGEVRVVREAAVAGLDGFVLSGPMGETHLAWNGDTLVSDRFANCRFSPPMPLAIDTGARVRRKWKGTVQGYWGKFEGEATLNQVSTTELVGGRKAKVVKTELVVANPKGKPIRLVTLFQPGVGIVSQHQWTGGDSTVKIERLSDS
jgi:hypothetical protein